MSEHPETLPRVAPSDIISFLIARNWLEINRIGSKAVVFERRDGERVRSVGAPLRQDLADYSARVADVIDAVAEFEGVSAASVTRDLIAGPWDIVRARAPAGDALTGVALEKAALLVTALKDLLGAAACAVADPLRPSYRVGKNVSAARYMTSARLQAAEAGSLIMTVYSPMETFATADPQLDLGDRAPFERRVVETVLAAAAATKHAIGEHAADRAVAPFDAAIAHGANANFCEAMATMAELGDGVEFSVSFSPRSPRERASFRFERTDAAILRFAADHYRANELRADERIEGSVVRLARGPDAVAGRVVVLCPLDGRLRSVSASFEETDYARVVEAHRERRPIAVHGELYRGPGGRFELRSPRNLVVLDISDASDEDGAAP